MIEGVILWLMGKGLSEKVSRLVLLVGAVVGILLISASLKACYEHRIISDHEQKQTIQVLEKTQQSNDKAADARAKDEVANVRKSEARKEAIEKAPDESPNAASIALGCVRLREAGYDTTRFPACSGH